MESQIGNRWLAIQCQHQVLELVDSVLLQVLELVDSMLAGEKKELKKRHERKGVVKGQKGDVNRC